MGIDGERFAAGENGFEAAKAQSLAWVPDRYASGNAVRGLPHIHRIPGLAPDPIRGESRGPESQGELAPGSPPAAASGNAS